MRTLSQSSQHQLLESISQRSAFGARDQAMIRFTVNTGLRVAELVGLVVAHVCGAKPTGEGRMVRHTLNLPGMIAKGGRARTIPLNAEARQAVLEILKFNHMRGFSVERGRRSSPTGRTGPCRPGPCAACSRTTASAPISTRPSARTICGIPSGAGWWSATCRPRPSRC